MWSPFASHGMLVRSIRTVCHLPCRVKTGIHLWSEDLSKVPDPIECEHLPTQVGHNKQLQSGVDPGEEDGHAGELPSNHQLCFGILNPHYKLAALQKCKRTPYFRCFALIGGREISSVFNSVSYSPLRNFTVVTESYLAFYTGRQCITKIHFIYNTLQKMSLCRPTIFHGWMT